MKDLKAEIGVDSTEVKHHIGFLLVEEGHKLRMMGEEDMALEMETVGRNMIEDARISNGLPVGNDDEFEDTLYDVE
jgi:hypothetical protein